MGLFLSRRHESWGLQWSPLAEWLSSQISARHLLLRSVLPYFCVTLDHVESDTRFSYRLIYHFLSKCLWSLGDINFAQFYFFFSGKSEKLGDQRKKRYLARRKVGKSGMSSGFDVWFFALFNDDCRVQRFFCGDQVGQREIQDFSQA